MHVHYSRWVQKSQIRQRKKKQGSWRYRTEERKERDAKRKHNEHAGVMATICVAREHRGDGQSAHKQVHCGNIDPFERKNDFQKTLVAYQHPGKIKDNYIGAVDVVTEMLVPNILGAPMAGSDEPQQCFAETCVPAGISENGLWTHS
ncbi:MAG: hypothetical protein ACYDDO_13615 [Acidiferrobacterales bacterium]